ncbi:MAG: glycosyltransferase family 4 protein [Bacteroides sp.]|nr:glycosyltransferase family 4 protein [Bacteroides sp.]
MRTIILVAYYFKPHKGVGVLRPSYWYDQFKKDGYNIKVLTATPGNNDKNVIFINPSKKNLIKDNSFFWGRKCAHYIEHNLKSGKKYIIIITGGPFLQILPILRLKNKYTNAYWIIDYRDPLSGNSRNNSDSYMAIIKQYIKQKYEYIINNMADKIITVNKICKELLQCKDYSKVLIIDNGYDERVINNNSNNIYNTKNIVYAGKLYINNGFNQLIKALSTLPDDYKFIYIGPSDIPNSSRVKSLGYLEYSDTIKHIETSEIGVILTTGDPFESTTKVFDYFGTKKKILIITQGIKFTGFLNEITKDNPNVEWANNNIENIQEALVRLQRPYVEWNYSKFSRYNGYLNLKQIIENL